MNDHLPPSTLKLIRYAILGLSLVLLLVCGLSGYQCSQHAKQAVEVSDKRFQDLAQIKEGRQRELDAATVAIEPTGKLPGLVYSFRDDTRTMVTEPAEPDIPEVSQSLYYSSPYARIFSISRFISVRIQSWSW